MKSSALSTLLRYFQTEFDNSILVKLTARIWVDLPVSVERSTMQGDSQDTCQVTYTTKKCASADDLPVKYPGPGVIIR
jgi:hypothetical protein